MPISNLVNTAANAVNNRPSTYDFSDMTEQEATDASGQGLIGYLKRKNLWKTGAEGQSIYNSAKIHAANYSKNPNGTQKVNTANIPYATPAPVPGVTAPLPGTQPVQPAIVQAPAGPPQPVQPAIVQAPAGPPQSVTQVLDQNQPKPEDYGSQNKPVNPYNQEGVKSLLDVFNQSGLGITNPYSGKAKAQEIASAVARNNAMIGQQQRQAVDMARATHSGAPLAYAGDLAIQGTEQGSRLAHDISKEYTDKAYAADVNERDAKSGFMNWMANGMTAQDKEGYNRFANDQQYRLEYQKTMADIKNNQDLIALKTREIEEAEANGDFNRAQALKKEKAEAEKANGNLLGKAVQFIIGAGMAIGGAATGQAYLVPMGISTALGSITGQGPSEKTTDTAVNGVSHALIDKFGPKS